MPVIIRSRVTAPRNSPTAGGAEPAQTTQYTGSAGKNRNAARRFTWEIASIGVRLEEPRFWAKALGISGPQWMILMAVAELDQGQGIPVNAVSRGSTSIHRSSRPGPSCSRRKGSRAGSPRLTMRAWSGCR